MFPGLGNDRKERNDVFFFDFLGMLGGNRSSLGIGSLGGATPDVKYVCEWFSGLLAAGF